MTAEIPLPEQNVPLPESEEALLLRKKSNRGRLLAGIAGGILIIGGLATAYWISKTSAAGDISEYTVSVDSEVLTLRITASGKIVPFQSVNLSPKNAGLLQELMVEQGDRVKQGQLLAKMDGSNLVGQLIQAEAAFEQAQARLNELRAGSRAEEKEQAKARMARAEVDLLQRQRNRPPQIRESENQVSEAMAQLRLAEQRLKRFQVLVEKGADTRDRLDEAERNYNSTLFRLEESKRRLDRIEIQTAADIAQAEAALYEAKQELQLVEAGARPEVIRQAEAEVQRAKGQVVTMQNQVVDTAIIAPFDGVVTQKYATEGAFVTPTTSASSTSSATSTSIVALARGLEIIAEVPEVDIGQIKKDQLVDIRADAYPDQIFKGRVRLIAPEAIVEQNVTSFQVRIQVQTGQDKLRSGMNTDVTFLGETVRDALVVPTVAIATEKGQTGVYVPNEDNKPEFTPITIGSSFEDKTQVLAGIDRQERVFINFPKGSEPKEPED
ncbi:MAG: efflux RND transporter periplasmic adaptor subunit [Cyanobacteria bacterium P01_F01_bin.42]